MAPYSYYLSLSIVFVLGTALCFLNFVHLRIYKNPFYGPVFKIGTAEHKRVMKLASNRNLAILAILQLLTIINLIYAIKVIIQLNDPNHSYGYVLFISSFTLLLSVVGFFVVRKQYIK